MFYYNNGTKVKVGDICIDSDYVIFLNSFLVKEITDDDVVIQTCYSQQPMNLKKYMIKVSDDAYRLSMLYPLSREKDWMKCLEETLSKIDMNKIREDIIKDNKLNKLWMQ